MSECQRQYEVIEGLLDGGYGKGAAGDYWIHLAEGGWNPLILSRTVGERLFGVFFASANLLVQRQEIVRFLQLKVGRAEEEGGGWWGSLLEWVQSVECELFLLQNTVVHAAWGKPFFVETEGGSLSCLEVCPIVREPLEKLEDWSLDPFGAVLLEARGMDTVRASPLLHLLCRRLEVVFGQMANYWRAYVADYLPGGKFDPAQCPDSLHVLSNTPCASFFEESYFGVLKDCMRLMGVTAAPWKVRATAISRVNNPVDTIMLDDDVPRVLRLAKEVQEGHGSIQGFRCDLAARRQLQADRELREKERRATERLREKERREAERAEKTRVLQEQAEQKKREREKKKADLQKESVRKRARQESRLDGSPKRARVTSVVPTDPGPECVQPPVESRRSGRVRRVSVRLNDFVH